ncbi:hypothetical protein GC170_15885 [bacterium]|nr:hypothetical protein [bacterium]
MGIAALIQQISEKLSSQGDWVPKAILFACVFLVIITIGQMVAGLERRVAARVRSMAEKESPQKRISFNKGLFQTNDPTKKLPPFVNAIIPQSAEEQTTLQSRLSHAGFYSPDAITIFYVIKFVVCMLPAVFALIFIPIYGFSQIVMFATIISAIVGLIGPSFALDYLKNDRHYRLRKSLPDAMDLMVVCVEGGMSLQASIRKIATELKTIHPEISLEFTLVQLQTQMGMGVGKALEAFGYRTDLEEIRQLAQVISQSEKLGSSMARTLKSSAESLRLRRQQQAEAKAQKAAVKIMIPTVLFIFPAIFVVVLGPAMFQLSEMFSNMKN